ncbi:DUF3891 family protein [Nostoc flagelliforme FACHB-838]|uniref:DUF3891 family protein n=1 Tax=Nostoc flagelliforme FACHB-838 TaxID=2692904 RepID=A0ABR8E047_9NOSO|nr:DUF3891 family protein [Nostoc flagelliforme]MBD2535036.1 DUF3891 family protein [Nostoc flagelliforme FACHB-838]
MLHRLSKYGLICITQPHHAWLSGQFARAWGNEQFGEFVPKEEVCLAAEQHDIGWLQWEQQPTLNPQTGYPYNFTELPTEVHIDIWSGAKQLAFPLGRYATLLVSLHGTGLYERFTSWQNSHKSAEIVRDFLNNEYAFQQQMIDILKKDKYYTPYATGEVIERNKKLVATWDALSIILCMGKVGEQHITQVPTTNYETTLKLTLVEDKDNHYTAIMSPWAFQQSEIKLVYEGRLLQQTFIDEPAMREALISDCWVTLSTTLIPG